MNATENVTTQPPVLAGAHVRLEPLAGAHVAGLVAAAAQDPSLYDWSAIPQGEPAMRAYVDAALAERAAGTALPFATLRAADGVVLGSTRFFLIERWNWPPGHASAAPGRIDGCEIGYTWLGRGGGGGARPTPPPRPDRRSGLGSIEHLGLRQGWQHPGL